MSKIFYLNRVSFVYLYVLCSLVIVVVITSAVDV